MEYVEIISNTDYSPYIITKSHFTDGGQLICRSTLLDLNRFVEAYRSKAIKRGGLWSLLLKEAAEHLVNGKKLRGWWRTLPTGKRIFITAEKVEETLFKKVLDAGEEWIWNPEKGFYKAKNAMNWFGEKGAKTFFHPFKVFPQRMLKNVRNLHVFKGRKHAVYDEYLTKDLDQIPLHAPYRPDSPYTNLKGGPPPMFELLERRAKAKPKAGGKVRSITSASRMRFLDKEVLKSAAETPEAVALYVPHRKEILVDLGQARAAQIDMVDDFRLDIIVAHEISHAQAKALSTHKSLLPLVRNGVVEGVRVHPKATRDLTERILTDRYAEETFKAMKRFEAEEQKLIKEIGEGTTLEELAQFAEMENPMAAGGQDSWGHFQDYVSHVGQRAGLPNLHASMTAYQLTRRTADNPLRTAADVQTLAAESFADLGAMRYLQVGGKTRPVKWEPIWGKETYNLNEFEKSLSRANIGMYDAWEQLWQYYGGF